MPWDVTYVPPDDTVVLTHSGRVATQDAKEQVQLLMSLLKDTNTTRLLLDYSDATIDIPASDIFALPDYHANLGLHRGRSIAYVLPTSKDQVHAFIYHQIAAREEGYHFALFTTKDAAREWLRQSQNDQPGPPSKAPATSVPRGEPPNQQGVDAVGDSPRQAKKQGPPFPKRDV